MTATILPNGNLKITADDSDRAALKEAFEDNPDSFDSDATMADLLEPLTCNTKYDWCNPEDIGALTSAPILCIRNQEGEIKDAWAFMDYQVRSVQHTLLHWGEATFQCG